MSDSILCSWCDSIATVEVDSMDARCAHCDRRWFPADLTSQLIDALRDRIGVHAEVVGMGGGCEAVRVSDQRADGRFLHVSDGDAARPSTRAVYAEWLDDDAPDDAQDVALHVDVDAFDFDIPAAIDAIICAVALKNDDAS